MNLVSWVPFSFMRKTEVTFTRSHRVVLVDWASTWVTAMPYNGQFGLVQEALGSFGSHNYSHLFTDLYRSGELIDPVIGMRLDPANPRLTVGALNSEDYEGTLNWVEIVPNKHNFTQSNVFEFDGFRSRDLPLGPFTNSTPMLTAVDTSTSSENLELVYFIDLCRAPRDRNTQ